MRALLLLLFLPLLSQAATITSVNCSPADRSGCYNLTLSSAASQPTVTVQLTGTWVGTIILEGSVTGVDGEFRSLRAYPVDGNGSYTSSTSTNGIWMVPVVGIPYLRVRASSLTSGVVTITTQASLSSVPVDIVRAVGPTNGSLDIGAVTLSNATLGALGTESCTVGVARTLSVGTTAVPVPAVAMAGRTRIMIINASDNQDIRCVADPAASNPTCAVPGVGLPIFQKGSSVVFTVRDTVAVRCIACNASAPVAYQEEACVPP